MNYRSSSKTTLFLIEQLIVILAFAVCAAVCVKIFFASYIMVNEADELNDAIIIAESGTECFKASKGDMQKTARVLGGTADTHGSVLVFYDKMWNTCNTNDAAFILSIKAKTTESSASALMLCDLSVSRTDGTELIGFVIAAANGAIR